MEVLDPIFRGRGSAYVQKWSFSYIWKAFKKTVQFTVLTRNVSLGQNLLSTKGAQVVKGKTGSPQEGCAALGSQPHSIREFDHEECHNNLCVECVLRNVFGEWV